MRKEKAVVFNKEKPGEPYIEVGKKSMIDIAFFST
jgi:hypothetical protein